MMLNTIFELIITNSQSLYDALFTPLGVNGVLPITIVFGGGLLTLLIIKVVKVFI